MTSQRLRALAVRGRWTYRRFRWKVRKKRLPDGRAPSSSLRTTSLALFPVVLLLTASAAVLGIDWASERRSGVEGPFYAASDWALAPFQELRGQVVGEYAARFGVGKRLAGLIYETAIEERVDPNLAFRLVRTESSFHPFAVGPAGAVGLAQVRPTTARWLDSTITRERLFEAGTNLRLGLRYLRMLLDMYDHDTRLALLAYNRGPGTVAALLAIGEDPGNGYASRVMGLPRVKQIVVDPAPAGPTALAAAPEEAADEGSPAAGDEAAAPGDEAAAPAPTAKEPAARAGGPPAAGRGGAS